MLMYLQERRPHHHFGCLVKNIELMFETGEAPYPVERTMLTSGILDFALESRIRGYQKLDTPELAKVHYPSTRETMQATIVVMALAFVMALWLGLIDVGATRAVRFLIG